MSIFGTFADPTFLGFAAAAFSYFVLIAILTNGVGSLVFWLLVLLGAGALVFRLAFLGVVLPLAGYVHQHPLLGIGLGAAYVALGVLVALNKWRTFSKIEPLEYSKPPKNGFEIEERLAADVKRIPRAKNHKSRISRWISTWPVVLLDYVLTVMLHDFFQLIAEKTEAIFNRVARSSNADLLARYEQIKVEADMDRAFEKVIGPKVKSSKE